MQPHQDDAKYLSQVLCPESGNGLSLQQFDLYRNFCHAAQERSIVGILSLLMLRSLQSAWPIFRHLVDYKLHERLFSALLTWESRWHLKSNFYMMVKIQVFLVSKLKRNQDHPASSSSRP